MPVRLKKLIGMVIMVAWVIIYAFTAALWGDTHLGDSSKTVQMAYFLVMGVVWIVPVMGLIKWMYRAPAARSAPEPPQPPKA